METVVVNTSELTVLPLQAPEEDVELREMVEEAFDPYLRMQGAVRALCRDWVEDERKHWHEDDNSRGDFPETYEAALIERELRFADMFCSGISSFISSIDDYETGVDVLVVAGDIDWTLAPFDPPTFDGNYTGRRIRPAAIPVLNYLASQDPKLRFAPFSNIAQQELADTMPQLFARLNHGILDTDRIQSSRDGDILKCLDPCVIAEGRVRRGKEEPEPTPKELQEARLAAIASIVTAEVAGFSLEDWKKWDQDIYTEKLAVLAEMHRRNPRIAIFWLDDTRGASAIEQGHQRVGALYVKPDHETDDDSGLQPLTAGDVAVSREKYLIKAK